jgi:putative iron-regulated protein
MIKTLKALSFIIFISLITACTDKFLEIHTATVTKMQVTAHYTNMAYATYSDALVTAKKLQNTVELFISSPSQENLDLAKQAWFEARVPYGQTEVFRFGNPNVDAWEGKVNAWPLDEGLIDYVDDDSYEFEDGNRYGQANIISGNKPISSEALRSYHEIGSAEVNVATGYHAIEFLLWGQDLNKKPTDAGLRPYTDYLIGEDCTHGNCERRAQYLSKVTSLLVSDLKDMVNDWAPGKNNYRKRFLALEPDAALRIILFGMGSLSLGELAGERLNVSLLAHSQEDEHSCFSDNTHVDANENARGIQNIYLGHYQRIDGSVIKGPSVADLVAQSNSELAQKFANQMQTTMKKALVITNAARAGEAFDQQIKAGNKIGNERIRAMIIALKSQAATLQNIANEIGIKELSPQSSDSL